MQTRAHGIDGPHWRLRQALGACGDFSSCALHGRRSHPPGVQAASFLSCAPAVCVRERERARERERERENVCVCAHKFICMHLHTHTHTHTHTHGANRTRVADTAKSGFTLPSSSGLKVRRAVCVAGGGGRGRWWEGWIVNAKRTGVDMLRLLAPKR